MTTVSKEEKKAWAEYAKLRKLAEHNEGIWVSPRMYEAKSKLFKFGYIV